MPFKCGFVTNELYPRDLREHAHVYIPREIREKRRGNGGGALERAGACAVLKGWGGATKRLTAMQFYIQACRSNRNVIRP